MPPAEIVPVAFAFAFTSTLILERGRAEPSWWLYLVTFLWITLALELLTIVTVMLGWWS